MIDFNDKCSCFRVGGSYGCYCTGTKECEPCNCNGDKLKCDFYETVRKKAEKALNTNPNWTDNTKKDVSNESVNEKHYEPFEWVSYQDDQPIDNGSVQSFLVCIKGHSVSNGGCIIKTCLFGKDFQLSSWEKENLLYWCKVAPPDSLIKKSNAIKTLQKCGILDENGDLVDVYKDILIKVDDL